jgi:hypothetical protein
LSLKFTKKLAKEQMTLAWRFPLYFKPFFDGNQNNMEKYLTKYLLSAILELDTVMLFEV